MGWENDVHANMTTLFAKQVLWSPSFLDKPLDKKKLSSKNCNLRFILVYFIVFPTLSMTPPMASNDLQWNALDGNCWVRGSTCSPWVSVKGPLLVSLRRHQERRGVQWRRGVGRSQASLARRSLAAGSVPLVGRKLRHYKYSSDHAGFHCELCNCNCFGDLSFFFLS